MKVIEKKITIEMEKYTEYFFDRRQLVFFDIETDGIRTGDSSVYLIASVYYDEDSWKILQLFSEDRSEEYEIIKKFILFLNCKKETVENELYLISYNGDMFDIPFLRSAAKKYGLDFDVPKVLSIDLYRRIRKYKKVLPLDNLKLKTLEIFLGIGREDKYSGGELIYAYDEYVRLSGIIKGGCEDTSLNKKLKENLLKILLLHNFEDVKNLPAITAFLAVESFFSGAFEIENTEIRENYGIKTLMIKLKPDIPFAFEIKIENEFGIFKTGNDNVMFYSKVYENELKYFFKDYKNYYYLPQDDCAVHKSIAVFMQKTEKCPAKASNCYEKVNGNFLLKPEKFDEREYYDEYKGKKYIMIDEKFTGSSEKVKEYLIKILMKR